MAGVRAFREAFMTSDVAYPATFESWDGRQARYEILWAMFENTAYRNLHAWSTKLKSDYGLYRHIRNIYNPANRLGIFWQTHLLGGSLDAAAGDGQEVPSAIPIVTDNEAQREAISQIWTWSNWATRKDIYGLWGATLGDVGLRVIDDPEKGKVYLSIVHPGTLGDVTFDALGNVKAYTIVETRNNPNRNLYGGSETVTYTEVATRDGDEVVYQTYLNDNLYAWFGDRSEWSEPYGFIPLVLTKHFDVGLDWGWAEIYPLFSKAREVDDQASKLDDQVRKLVDAPWFFAGVDKPKKDVIATGKTATTDRPEPGREEIPAMYGPQGATASPLVAPLDIAAVGANIDRLLAEIERDLPELQNDIWSVGNDPSGKALRVARQRVEAKVQMRRPNYDDGLKRALQMAMSIGGFRNYDDFAGFNLDSYKAGNLEFSIGDRPVFVSDPMDAIEESAALWTAANTASRTGMPLNLFLKSQGWNDAAIQEIMASPYYQQWVASTLGMA
jgi:hypothetical protein